MPLEIIEHVILHQFHWIATQLSLPTTPHFKVYRLGSFHISKASLLHRLKKTILVLRRDNSSPSYKEFLTLFFSKLWPLRHEAKIFSDTSQIRYWSTADAATTAQRTSRHTKGPYRRATSIYS